jgi:tRNA(adenine34) deaminase
MGGGAPRRAAAGPYHPSMNYELFMGEALAEGRVALEAGESPGAAVAVLDEAMVGRAHDQVRALGDPTAHAVLAVLRDAARRLGPERLGELTIFTTQEPCAMCSGALLACEVDEVVYAVPDLESGAAASVLQRAGGRGPKVVSGIRRDEAEELLAAARS